MQEVMDGVVMELQDCCFPLLIGQFSSCHSQATRSGDKCSRLLQLIFAAVEFACQRSAVRPHILLCSFVKQASLWNMLCGLTTGAGW